LSWPSVCITLGRTGDAGRNAKGTSKRTLFSLSGVDCIYSCKANGAVKVNGVFHSGGLWERLRIQDRLSIKRNQKRIIFIVDILLLSIYHVPLIMCSLPGNVLVATTLYDLLLFAAIAMLRLLTEEMADDAALTN
jgi:hypothetical protein